MFVMNVDKNIATISTSEPMTSGSSNVYLVQFYFSPEWDDLNRVAVFRSGDTVIDVLLDDDNLCFMPWEVLTSHSVKVQFGVYGTKNGNVVLPTIWANTEPVLEGVITNADENPPSASLYKQILDRLGELERDKYEFGHGLKQDGLVVSVDMATNENPDKTLPISAADAGAMIGNIEYILQTI